MDLEVFAEDDNLGFRVGDPGDFMTLKQLDRYLDGHNGFVAGGVFKNIFSKEPFKDVDVFFRNSVDHYEAVEHFGEKEYELLYENETVTCFKDPDTGARIELINTVFGTPAEVIDGFDFTVTKFAYYRKETGGFSVLFHDKFFEHLHLRRLVIDDRLVKPINTFERSYRYNEKGFKLCRGSKAKLLNAIMAQDSVVDDELTRSLYAGLD